MARISPVQPMHAAAHAMTMGYGSEAPIEVVGTYGELELEYAAIRKHCVLVDLPQRGVVEVTGKDRLGFLNRMITQELKGMAEFSVRRSFWLNRKGRIDADLRVINLPGRVLLEVDAHAAERTVAGLASFVIAEDVTVRDIGEETHRFALHGPSVPRLLPGVPEVDGVGVISIGGVEVVVYREDSTGEVGAELIVKRAEAEGVYRALIADGHDAQHGAAVLRGIGGGGRTLGAEVRLRPAGWHAYNIARIEAGTPVFNIDFGTESLPAETGVLEDRVSFKKGCYLGQEVVARMHSRGHSKQTLVGVKFEAVRGEGEDFPYQPVSGAGLFVDGEQVGAVTSSTLSPMLGSAPIALAAVKPAHKAAGSVVMGVAGGVEVRGVVQEGLKFWGRG